MVLDKGNLVEYGPEKALLAHKGLYYHLYNQQFGSVPPKNNAQSFTPGRQAEVFASSVPAAPTASSAEAIKDDSQEVTA
jgi:hypothetical protein